MPNPATSGVKGFGSGVELLAEDAEEEGGVRDEVAVPEAADHL
jgi:hypothetical protein